jgi:hypothetical protein
MKLFILNKEKFNSAFCVENGFQKIIHQRAFKELKKKVESENSIPILLMPDMNAHSIVVFDFVSVSKDKQTFYYNFKGIL